MVHGNDIQVLLPPGFVWSNDAPVKQLDSSAQEHSEKTADLAWITWASLQEACVSLAAHNQSFSELKSWALVPGLAKAH